MEAGATKMVFSVFADAACTKSANRARSLMVLEKSTRGRKHERRSLCHHSTYSISTAASTQQALHFAADWLLSVFFSKRCKGVRLSAS